MDDAALVLRPPHAGEYEQESPAMLFGLEQVSETWRLALTPEAARASA